MSSSLVFRCTSYRRSIAFLDHKVHAQDEGTRIHAGVLDSRHIDFLSPTGRNVECQEVI